ncbi:MAG: outer membrane beta-barrel protein, partial [Flavobacteriaceae bacterium]|nr:outer membrane beta-barrel protein [Candidatus Onthonaster equi]
MNKLLFLLSIIGTSAIAQAQQTNNTQETEFNKWSVEIGGGANKAVSPFTKGYYSETPDFYNANVGVRYMINNKFGLKLSGNYDRLKEGKDSKDFKSDFYRIDLSGVANLGRIMNFEDWTNTIGLLGHAGAGYGFMKNDASIGDSSGILDDKDEMGLVTLGLTPQVKLSNRVVLTGDLSYTKTLRQNTTWDGQTNYGNSSRGFDGAIWNATLGLTFYLGGNQKHADWAYDATRNDLEDRINNIENMLKDSDNDGVADYLDQEPNSAPGAVVDTKGVTIDHNGNGIPDNIEEYIKANGGSTNVINDTAFLEQMINSGIINVYFDYNSDQPYTQSVGGTKFVSEYL